MEVAGRNSARQYEIFPLRSVAELHAFCWSDCRFLFQISLHSHLLNLRRRAFYMRKQFHFVFPRMRHKVQGHRLFFAQTIFPEVNLVDYNFRIGRSIDGYVRLMRIRVMNPGEESVAFLLFDPGQRKRIHFGSNFVVTAIVLLEIVFILIEMMSEAEATSQNAKRNKAGCTVAMIPQHVGKQRPIAIVTIAIVKQMQLIGWMRAENYGMRGQGDRDQAEGFPEEDAFLGQSIDVGSRRRTRVVTTQIIGAECIDRNQDDIVTAVRISKMDRDQKADENSKNNQDFLDQFKNSRYYHK